MATRVLVTGASGMLGRAVMRALDTPQFTALGTARSRVGGDLISLDICDAEQMRRVVLEAKPAAVIHCAAERRPDVSERDKEYTTKVNAEASALLAKLCAEAGAWMVYVSTDYVFDGQPGTVEAGGPYKIDADCRPVNHYGITKRLGEVAVLAEPDANAVVMRVPVLYGLDCESLSESASLLVAEVLRNGGPDAPKVQVDDWGIRFPTLVDDVATCIARISEMKLQDPKACTGIVHFSSPEVSTKYQLALLMARILDMSSEHLQPDPNVPRGAARPKNTQLDCSETWEMLGGMPKMVSLAEGMERALEPFSEELRQS